MQLLSHPRANSRPFSDWLADAQRQCARRTGVALFANDAPESYWRGSYWSGVTARDAADVFVKESRDAHSR